LSRQEQNEAKVKTWQQLRIEGAWSISKAMMDIYRLFQEHSAEGYAKRGFYGLTVAHVHFLSQVEEAGTHISTVAGGLGTTKQYASRLARELESKGLIELVSDPNDRRAVLVYPKEKGRAFLEAASEVRQELERWFDATLGPDLAQQFMQILSRLAKPTSSAQ
jgi:DNA-binding MarR family transcriptional regulator